jgi:hypothetical protein
MEVKDVSKLTLDELLVEWKKSNEAIARNPRQPKSERELARIKLLQQKQIESAKLIKKMPEYLKKLAKLYGD